MILIKDTKRSNIHHSPYQNISDQIYLLMKDKNLKSILITAASPMEGSTTIIANLANYLSNVSGHKTIIIDANLRSPSIHKILESLIIQVLQIYSKVGFRCKRPYRI